MTQYAMSALAEAFLEDHRAMMRALTQLKEKVESQDLAEAQKLAARLDETAGAHIQFEEEVLYPEVGRPGSGQTERELRNEHSAVRDALAKFLRADLTTIDGATLSNELSSSLETALDHAENCGTMLSLLRTMPEPKQRDALARLIELRKLGMRWTQL